MDLSHFARNSQCPCFAILYRALKYHESDFKGWVVLENGSFFWSALFVTVDIAGQEYLRLFLQPELCKTPIGSYPGGSRRYFAVLRRLRKSHDWQSDFKGWVVLEARTYRIGIYVCIARAGRQYLQLYLRPATPASWKARAL
jgi:hypothetical protein